MSKMSNATKRILAVALTMLLVFGMVPVSAVPVSAATTEYPEAVTVTVKDGEGNPVSGAEVSYTITDSADVEIKNDKVTTNANGSAEVLAKADYKDGLKISGSVTKDGYESKSIEKNITSDNEDIEVTISAKVITGITVVALNTQCKPDKETGKAKKFDAVSVQGTAEGDTVLYQLDGGEATDKVPQISIPGKYKVKVTVKRNGYVDFVKDTEAKITDLYFTEKGKESVFNGEPQELLKGTNCEGLTKYYGYSFEFYVGDEKTTTIPKRTNVGEYAVRVVGESSFEGLSRIDKVFNTKITPAELNDGVVSITPYSGAYDAASHPAVQVEALQGKKLESVSYSQDGTNWSAEVPQIKNAGSYPVYVKVKLDDDNYKETEKTVTAMISTADRKLEFNKFVAGSSSVSMTPAVSITDGKVQVKFVTDFGATAENKTKDEKIVYSVDSSDATIDDAGTFRTSVPGTYKVKASIAATADYHEAEIEYTITVKAKTTKDYDVSFVEFENTDKVVYVLNKDNNLISNRQSKITVADDDSNVTYSIKGIRENGKEYEVGGVYCDSVTGEIKVSDYNALVVALNRSETNGVINAVVTAKKSDGKLSGKDSATYEIQLRFADTPEAPVSLSFPITKYGWINDEIIVTPKTGYTVAKGVKYGNDSNPDPLYRATTIIKDGNNIATAFKNTVKFGDEGITKRTVYLCDNAGYICGPVDLKINLNGAEQDLKVDRTVPTALEIDYSTEIDSVGDAIKTLFYRDTVTVTFKATDTLSGIDRFVCEYDEKEIPVENFQSLDDGKSATATAEITVKKGDAVDGNVSLTVYDRAGNVSKKKGNDTVIIDYISPKLAVEYLNPVKVVPDDETTPKTYYFNETTPLVYKVKVKETNGFEENGSIKVFKDGAEFAKATVKYERLDDDDDDDGYDIYTVTVPSTEENQGVYTVEAYYVDKSTNQMEGNGVETVKIIEDGVEKEVAKFVSDEMVIDVTDPVISFEYNENKKHDGEPCDDYAVTLTVTEVNFDPASFVATVEAKDIKENIVAVDKLNNYITDIENWKSVGNNKYECTLTYGENGVLPDANYKNIKFQYTDLAKNSGEKNSEEFIIDTTAPTAPVIEYEESLWPVIAEVLTLGLSDEIVYKYFNAPTTITLTSTDATWGVESFVLTYNRQKGESKSNVEKLYIDNIEATPSETDNDVFTAQVTLPKEEADQLRGSMTAYAIDKHGIKSESVTDDGTVIVVDDIAPEVSVAYSKAQPKVTEDNKAYYNNDIVGTITVEEANFYAEDVVLSVTRDGVEIEAPAIEWSGTVDADGDKEDVYTGTFTLPALADHSTDGDYIVKVSYTDRSTKEAEAYESDILVIDTTAPVINVAYSNTTPENKLPDPYIEGAEREYFRGQQVATITITEHNFFKDEVDLSSILEQDVSGNPVAQTRIESDWVSDGDVHTMTITYPGNANYTFDIDYADLADNAAADYTKDYFTVDNTLPVIVKAEQKNDVASTFINNITFGYFGEKAQVEVTVTDDISFANIVEATYEQADGTSSVNKTDEKQTAKAEKIEILNEGKTAKTTFVMPKGILEKGNNMNGSVKFVATDRAGNKSNGNVDGKDITGVIVDNITPKAKIELSKPYTTENKISYYDGKITGTITVTEANFDNPEEFKLSYSKDGAKGVRIPLKWTHKSVNTHIATFTLTQDGDYILTATYKDRSKNEMATYKSNQLTIDTKINAPVITFQGDSNGGLGFNDEVIPGVKFEDDNYKSYQITLTRTRYDEKNIDVKDQFIGNRVAINANGGSGTFNTFEKIRDNDGVYTLTVKMTDKVDHSSTTSRTFVVNRFGSVYVYNDALIDLINDRYTKEVAEDLVITEYNANKLKESTLKVDITRDGRPVDKAIASTAPAKNSGWYEYAHTINRENFNSEGLYKIAVSSTDEVNNNSENKEDKNTLDKKFTEIKDVLWFKVDKTLPSITSFTITEEASNKKDYKGDYDGEYTEIKAENANVEFTVYDAIGIAKVEVIVDGITVEVFEGKELGDDINNFTGKFKLSEEDDKQKVVIKVTDLSGRVLDTANIKEAKDSIPESFTGSMLVSSNFFVRFWNNQPVFWGVVGGTVGAAALIIILILLKKRKKKDEK